MNKRRMLKLVMPICAVILLLGGAAVAAITWNIHSDVQRFCSQAQQVHPHPGDDVASLIDYMKADTHALRDRNHAVWAVGRLSDSKALPALTVAHTGSPCDHSKSLCQHELRKAIKRCGGKPVPASANVCDK